MSMRISNNANAETSFSSSVYSDTDSDPLTITNILFRKGMASQLASLGAALEKGDVKNAQEHIDAIKTACAGISAKRMFNTADYMKIAVRSEGISDSSKALLGLMYMRLAEFDRTTGERTRRDAFNPPTQR